MVEITDIELQARTEELVQRAEQGEEFTVTVEGRPVGRLLPISSSTSATMEL
jgi:prevent-host-death family protein